MNDEYPMQSFFVICKETRVYDIIYKVEAFSEELAIQMVKDKHIEISEYDFEFVETLKTEVAGISSINPHN